jgi:transcriptional regulator with XRE-family HTH domain
MRISAAAGIDLLRKEQIDVQSLGAGRVLIDGRESRLFVRQNVPSPSELYRAKGLYVLPRISPGLRKLATQNHELILSAPGALEIWHRGKRILGTKPAASREQASGKVNWARFGLLRTLARTAKPRTQKELAQELGITQGAVSQNLSKLDRLVIKTKDGWQARSFSLVATEFLEHYPGPGGIEQAWFALDAVIPQGERVLKANPWVLLSADSAADELAPYRRARTSMVYTPMGLKLEDLGFARSSREKATLIEVIPDDRTIFPLAKANSARPFVDGLLVVYDLKRSAGPDADAAAKELLLDLEESWVNAHD